MNYRNLFLFSRGMRRFIAGCFIAYCLIVQSGSSIAGEHEPAVVQPPRRPFQPGEKLTFTISWSKVFSAGIAVMEVKKEKGEDDRPVYRFISTASTTGMVDKFYPVRDVVQSVVDHRTLRTISYDLSSSHGTKKKVRKLLFDHEEREVTYFSDGDEDVVEIPENTQDALSSLYYVRTQPEFIVGKSFTVDIHDSGKNWAVEIHVLGRERIKTPVGEFDTIKVKTYPRYEGVFMHKGEIFMWFTDDSHRVPVLMKSTITIGSIVATLTDMKLGDGAQ